MADRYLVTLDGAVLDPDVPLLHADDLSVVRGDGIFETLLVRGGSAKCVEPHLERLASSARALDLPKPDLQAWREAIETGVRTWTKDHPNDEGLLRLVYSRGRESNPVDAGGEATAYLTVSAVPARAAQVRQSGVKAVTFSRGFSIDVADAAPWQLLGAKTLSYATNMAALRYAAKQGADEVIFVSSEGQLLEGPRSTVVIARSVDKDGAGSKSGKSGSKGIELVTPPTEIGILAGTTQRALFDLAEKEGYATAYRNLRPSDLIEADGVWMVSSVTLAARVVELNQNPLVEPSFAAEFVDLVDRAVDTDVTATVD